MYPETLPTEQKLNWAYADCFSGEPDDLVRSFLHKHYGIGMHTHDFFEINIVLHGEGRHYIRDSSCVAKRGCVFILPPGMPHGYHQERDLDVYHILIAPSLLERYRNELDRMRRFFLLFSVEPMLRGKLDGEMLWVLDDGQMEWMRQSIRRLDDSAGDSYPGNHTLRNLETLLLVGQMCRWVEKHTRHPSPGKKMRYQNEILRMMEYVHTHCEEAMDIASLAQQCSLSKATFQRAFARITGTSVHAYIQMERIRKAQELLRSSSQRLSDIAQGCGFYDASHFSQAFHRLIGMTPSEYRAGQTE